MTRLTTALSLFAVVSFACGHEAAAPAHEGTTVAAAPAAGLDIENLDGVRCEADPTPVAVQQDGFGSETSEEGDDVTWRVSRRNGDATVGAICHRGAFGGEVSANVQVSDVTLGDTPVTLVVDTAACMATCEEGEDTARCESSVTTAWVLDRELHFIAGVIDQQGRAAHVDGNVLVVGDHRRTLQGGALVAAP